ncbi:MAG: hypothetical protein ACPGID_11020 [Rubricella sp.]
MSTTRFVSAAALVAALSLPAGLRAEISDRCIARLDGERASVLVPNAPGGGYDTYARALAPAIEEVSGMVLRVVNMPAAGGRAARALAADPPRGEFLYLIENTSDLVTTETGIAEDGTRTLLVQSFDSVGILHLAPEAWAARTGFDLADASGGPIIAGAGTISDAVIPVILAAEALGREAQIVGGYSGSTDQAAAAARGETDMTSVSLQSAERLAAAGTLDVVLILSDTPAPAHPDVPVLAGPEGIVWAMTDALDPAERDRRRALAQLSADLSGSVRSIHVSMTLPEEDRTCLAEALNTAMEHPTYLDAIAAQGRPITNRTAEEARALTARMIEGYLAAADLIGAARARVEQ